MYCCCWVVLWMYTTLLQVCDQFFVWRVKYEMGRRWSTMCYKTTLVLWAIIAFRFYPVGGLWASFLLPCRKLYFEVSLIASIGRFQRGRDKADQWIDPAFRYRDCKALGNQSHAPFVQQEINRHSRAHVVKAANLATFILKLHVTFSFIQAPLSVHDQSKSRILPAIRSRSGGLI